MSLQKLQKRFRELRKQAEQMNVTVFVGFGARHALIVHEDQTMEHKSGKQGKFLEGPARQHSREIFGRIAEEYQNTNNPVKALLAGGRLLKQRAQEIVPVDTGALHSSAYVCLEADHTSVASEAEDRANSILGTKK